MADEPIPQDLVDDILAKCARHCCVCRRHKPLHLQVHHIVPRSEGGTNDLGNLIAVCLTCHCDVHTKTYFTRRFTPGELNRHRDDVFKLVAEGKLPYAADPDVSVRIPRLVAATGSVFDRDEVPISETAREVLVRAANSTDGMILMLRSSGGSALQVEGKNLIPDQNPRTIARYEHAMDQLSSEGLIEERDYEGNVFYVTYPGYVLADELMAAGMQAEVK